MRDSGASRTVTSRVSPDGSIQSPASMPANAGRSAWPTCPIVTPSEPARLAVDLDVELRLLPLGREPDVNGTGHLSDDRRGAIRDLLQLHHVGALQLELNLLAPVTEAGGDRRRHAGQLGQLAAQLRAHVRLVPLTFVLRRELHEDGACVHRFAAPADGGVGVGDFRLLIAPAATPPPPSAACRRDSIRAASRARC